MSDNTDAFGGGDGSINDAGLGGMDIASAEASLGENPGGMSSDSGNVDLTSVLEGMAMSAATLGMIGAGSMASLAGGLIGFAGGSIALGSGYGTEVTAASIQAGLDSDPSVAAAQIAGLAAYDAVMTSDPYTGQGISEVYTIANNVAAAGLDTGMFWQSYVCAMCGYWPHG